MALKDGMRIKETTTTTGAGTLSLAGAPTGFNTIVSEIGTGNTMFYWLADANTIDWEMGIGTITAGAPNTFARTTVLRSTNANAALVLSTGTHTLVNAPVPGYSTGNTDYRGNAITNYAENAPAPAIAAGVLTLDLSTGNVFNVAHNANITTLTITNATAAGKMGSFTLILTQDATGGRTLAFPAAVKWSGGTVGAPSTTALHDNVLAMYTVDAGTTWRTNLVGKDYA